MFTNNNFMGEINGEELWDFIKGLDYNNRNLEDRLKIVNDKLHMYKIEDIEFYKGFWDDFFEQTLDVQISKDGVFYIDEEDSLVCYDKFMTWCKKKKIDPVEYLDITTPFDDMGGDGTWKYSNVNTSNIKLVLNKTDSLYSDSNVAKCLEILGTYLLSSDECNKRTDDNIKIYDSYELFKRAMQEHDLIRKSTNANGGKQMIKQNGSGDLDGEPMIIFKNDKNYMLEKDIKVEDKDIKIYPEIKPYHDLLKLYNDKYKKLIVKKQTSRLSNKERLYLAILKEGRKDIKSDMLDMKVHSMKRFVRFKSPCSSHTDSMFKEIVIPNKREILNVLKVLNDKYIIDTDAICCRLDIENILDKCKFTEKQKEILHMWKMDMTVTEIAEKLGIEHKQVNSMLNSVTKKILRKYEEQYEDWIGFNYKKSEWKTCSRCGESKLLKRFQKNGDRLRSNCINCDSRY